jgi:hypothetical protein
MSGCVCSRRRHRNRLEECGHRMLRIAGSPQETKVERSGRVLVYPVVMRSADGDQIFHRVWATLRAA